MSLTRAAALSTALMALDDRTPADPVQRTTVLAKSVDGLSTAKDEDAVEHGGAHALEVVVGLHTLSALTVLPGSEDWRAARANGEGKGLSGSQGGLDACIANEVKSIGSGDGHTVRRDGGPLRQEVELTEVLGFLSVAGALCLLRDGTADIFGDLLC